MLSYWAAKHGINPQALRELELLIGIHHLTTATTDTDQKSEKAVQQYVKLRESQLGNRLWRNNNGATYDPNGRMIRYGLANESTALSKKFKSSDLIGITPRVIQTKDVGHIWGIFTSIEIKKTGWNYTNTPREQAQYAWIQLVVNMGGIGKFTTGMEYE